MNSGFANSESVSSHGYSIRPAEPADADAIAAVHGQSWDESYRGLLPDEIIDRQMTPEGFLKSWRQRLTHPEPDSAQVLVAEAMDESGASRLVGFVSAGSSRDDWHDCKGEIRALYLLKAFQKRGIGDALWNAGVRHLAAQELLPGHVVTLVENPTVGFYQRVGAVEFERATCRHEWAQHLEEISLRFDGPSER